jgi:RNA polymerase sigma-70 factor (ECF subfamily)
MVEPTFDTHLLQGLLERMRAGDGSARNELVRATQNRLEGLARRMLRRSPTVARWAETGDVFQGAVLRLLRALEEVSPPSSRDFLNLAAAMVRRELIDLARRFQGPHGIGAHHDSVASRDGLDSPLDRPAPDPPSPELDRWVAFHEEVGRLPAELREVFGLAFYHGWTQEQIAQLLGVDVRTVRRRWRAAVETLVNSLGEDLPEP